MFSFSFCTACGQPKTESATLIGVGRDGVSNFTYKLRDGCIIATLICTSNIDGYMPEIKMVSMALNNVIHLSRGSTIDNAVYSFNCTNNGVYNTNGVNDPIIYCVQTKAAGNNSYKIKFCFLFIKI